MTATLEEKTDPAVAAPPGETVAQPPIDLSKLPRVPWWIYPYVKHILQRLVNDADDAVRAAVILLLDGNAADAHARLAAHQGADALAVISVAFTCAQQNNDALRSARQASLVQGLSAAIWLWLCALLRLMGGTDTEQEEAIAKCFELDPEDSIVRSTKAHFLHFVRKDYAGAVREYERAIGADPKNSCAHNGYGWLLKDVLQDHASAEREFKLAINSNPNNSHAHNGYGCLLKDVRQNYNDAQREFQLAIQADPNYSDAHLNYGHLLGDVFKDVVGAEREFNLACGADPSNSVTTSNLASSKMSRIVDRANRVQQRAEIASDLLKSGLQAINVVLQIGTAVPVVGDVCGVARKVLKDVQNLHDRADDVIAAGRRVVEVLETLQWFAENAKKLNAYARWRLNQRMRKLEQLLNAVSAAVCAFGRPGFLKKMFRVAKKAKTLKRLDRDIRDALQKLRDAYGLGRDQKFLELLQNQRYTLEEAIEKGVQDRIKKGETAPNAIAGLETNVAEVRAIAIAGGVSNDIFQQELGEFREEVRDYFNRASEETRHRFNRVDDSIEEIRNNLEQVRTQKMKPEDLVSLYEHVVETKMTQPTARQECADDYLAHHYEHVAATNADSDNPLHIQSIVGQGSFGKTHRMRTVIDHRERAVKLILLQQALKSVSMDTLYREGRVLSLLHHAHVVKFYGDRVFMTLWSGKCLAIVMEFLPGGTLRERIQSSTEVDLKAAAKWVQQLASALAHVHSHNIQHRDLKLENVLLDARDDVPLPALCENVRLADFGSACVHEPESFVDALPESRLYSSPEEAQDKRYDFKDDISGLGCIGASLIAGKPFESRASASCAFALNANLVNALKIEVGREFRREAHEILGHVVFDCLKENPENRPVAKAVEDRLRERQNFEPRPLLPNIPNKCGILLLLLALATSVLLVNNLKAHYASGCSRQNVRADNAGAERQCRLATKVDPDNSNAHFRYARLLHVRKDYAGAVREYELAIKADPNNSKAHFRYARLLQDVRRDYTGAEREYKRAIQTNPNRSNSHFRYGRLLHKVRKDYAGAEHQYTLAIELDPNNLHAKAHLAKLLQRESMSRWWFDE